MKKLIVIFIFSALAFQAFPQSREVPFTLDDRDRIMRTEERIESLRNEMNTKFEVVDQRFETMESKFDTLYWGFGILIALMLFLFGYIVWDRRTALNPIQTKTSNLEERLSKLEFISRAQAKKDPVFAELLKQAGLL
jgi:hypothetical protein